MKIYIPKHLREIKIIEQLYQMMTSYGEQAVDEIDSFSDFQWSLSNDPVKRFLGLCIPKRDDQTSEDYSSNINYLATLFYSVKGTYKVFDYLLYYGVIDSDKSKINYTARSISIEIGEILVGKDLFCSAMEDFLKTLLYFESLEIIIDSAGINLEGSIVNHLGHGEIYYQHHIAE